MRHVVTEQDVPSSGALRVPAGSSFTPAARDLIRDRGIEVLLTSSESVTAPVSSSKVVAIGSDQSGFQLKQALKPLLAELGWTLRDVGVLEEKSADYPDIAHSVASLVSSGEAAWGVIVDDAGIGSAMAANKVPGIRAAACHDAAAAKIGREHHHANVLALGAKLLTAAQAEEVLRSWLATPWGGGRHQGRIDKITEIERRYSTWTQQKSKD